LSTAVGALKTQWRTIHTLLLLDIRTRYIKYRLGFLMAFIDPIIFVAFMCLFFSAMGRHPVIGDSLVMFFATAIFPFFCYRTTQTEVSTALQKNKSLFSFPILKPLDLLFAVTINQVVSYLLVFMVFTYGYVVVADISAPDDVGRMILPFAIFGLIGFSMGLITRVIGIYFGFWKYVMKFVSRITMLTSGKFFIADSLPQNVQNILYYNPFLHLTEYARSAYYAGFESRFMDMRYPLTFAFVSLFIALVLERVFRNKLLIKG